MEIGFGLLPIVGGYFLLTWCYRTRYHLLRQTGYHVFFQSSVAGVGLVIAAYVIFISLNPFIEMVENLKTSVIPNDPRIVAPVAIISVLLGLISPFGFNLLLREEEEAIRTARNYGNFIEVLIVESIHGGMEVELSLKNRKWYVGFPIKNEAIGSGGSDIELIPIASGYRDKDTLDLELTTEYSINGFGTKVIIPRSEIVTARSFIPIVQEDDEQGDGEGRAGAPA